jgi:hypothetical protein
MRLRVLYHGNCFDGSSSAGLFARFYRERIATGQDLNISFASLEHRGEGPAIRPELLDGEVNACVDFRYTQDPRLNWWFDHHISAFQQPGDEAHFLADRSGQKFYNPTAKSCARFLANTVAEKFGFDIAPLEELIHWAEIIDGALFPHPQMPVELEEPALRLMTWVENNRDPVLAERFILDLVSRPLGAIAATDYVAAPLGPILAQHRRNVDLVKRVATLEDGVVFSDLAAEDVGTLNKFIVYYHHPRARYAVSLLSAGSRVKISVGSNPWGTTPRTHNIAAICERYGGGGHPVVGAISVPRGELERARGIAKEIVAELRAA